MRPPTTTSTDFLKHLPTGWIQSAVIFGVAAGLLFVVTKVVIPILETALGIEAIVSWFIAAGLLVFAPLCALGWWLLTQEGSVSNLRSLAERLWLRPMTGEDWLWCAGALATIAATSLLVHFGLHAATGQFDLSPSFMKMEPLDAGRYWILFAWVPFWLLNILSEEFLWRGVILPRQEAALGQHAWAANVAGWLIFHFAFGPELLLTLAPIIIVLPYVVQRRRNTTVGVVIHAALNGPGFLAVALGFI